MLDDAKSLVLAKSGREEFVNPEGAPIVYTLRQDGWTNLVDIDDLIKHGPGGVEMPLEPLIGIVGIGGNPDYVNAHQNTVLRFMSVVWRTIAATKTDTSLYELQAPYLNSMAGTSLDGKGVADTVAILHPYTTFENDKQYRRQRGHHLRKRLDGDHQGLRSPQHHPRRQGHCRRRGLGRADMDEMVDYRAKTDELMEKMKGATLSPDKQALADKAKTFYTNFDFLDAYRLALAAST